MDAPSPVNNTFVARLCALFVCNKCYGSPTAATKLPVSACYFFGSLSYMNTRAYFVFSRDRPAAKTGWPRAFAMTSAARIRCRHRQFAIWFRSRLEPETMAFSWWRILGTKSAREREFTRDTCLSSSCIRCSSDTWTRVIETIEMEEHDLRRNLRDDQRRKS